MVRNYKRRTDDRWTKDDLLNALVCIKDSKLKINEAAKQYGISRATLYRQFHKFMLRGAKLDTAQFRTCGGNPILTRVEEEVLENTIKDLRAQGFPVTCNDIKRICYEYCDSNGIPNQFRVDRRLASDDWYYGFLKRHPELKLPPKTKSLQPDNTAGKANKTSSSKKKKSTATPATDSEGEVEDMDVEEEGASDRENVD